MPFVHKLSLQMLPIITNDRNWKGGWGKVTSHDSNRRHIRNQNEMHNGRAHPQQGKGIAFESDLSMYALNNLCLSERALPRSLAREFTVFSLTCPRRRGMT